MKYLKIFEDYDNSGTKKLRVLVENYLAYLLDDNIKFNIELGNSNTSYTLFLTRYGDGFKWNDIKDSFIPFLHILLENYIVESDIRFGRYDTINKTWLSSEYFTIQKILNDDIYIDNIVSISIDLKEK